MKTPLFCFFRQDFPNVYLTIFTDFKELVQLSIYIAIEIYQAIIISIVKYIWNLLSQ